jgi:ELWxxDGT repeat protein
MKTLLQKMNFRKCQIKWAMIIAAAFGCNQTMMSQAASMLKDVNTGASNSSPYLFTYCGGLNCVFFVADNGSTGAELWKYDVSSSTASLIKDINSGATGSGITSMIPNVTNTGILFNANDGINGNELWKSDGTTGGTALVLDINTGTLSSNPANFYIFGGITIFSADNGINGKEPWLTTGTMAGTSILKDINPGAGASDPNSFTPVAGKLLFRANDGSTGSELWSTDMTTGGTVLLKDINTGTLSSIPLNFVTVGSNVFFSANNGTTGPELWKSDGTLAGTQLVKDINVGAVGSINVTPGAKAFFTAYNSNLYFQATDGSTGYELWKSDGTTAGTVLVKDIQAGSGSSTPCGILPTGTNMFFVANDGTNGMELWTSDGTTGGTTLLKDINPGSASSTTSLTTIVQGGVGAPIYFAANDGTTGTELWRTLGSSGTTSITIDINPGSASSSPASLIAKSNIVYFSATDGAAGIEPWQFDIFAAGINETQNSDITVKLFPNPNKGQLYLRSEEEKIDLSIYSVLGNKVMEKQLFNAEAKNYTIDLNELSSGIYFVKVRSGQRETVRKIILSQ